MTEDQPMAGDDALLERLRALAAAADGLPEHVREAAVAAFGLRDLDAQLAALVADSAEDGVLMRAAVDTEPRLLSFEAGDVAIDVEVAEERDRRRLVGVVAGAGSGPLTLQYADGTTALVELDDLGRFATDARPGLARLRVAGADGVAVVTRFFHL